ncbi:glycosyltransferase involved in cell wall biosynthesis [Microbacterium halimionae]|uniref:Glycosyltransferase involved in cell wall biosynthesis n=1 Tax=Microbacterium halimionae TaxID=1526413 RepID=A0A7W3PLH8_9MICO|nr:glycosyltransferase family 2 protein [Microbacterium halimionae]MBA8816026.1 glycosyltransferase involved in cell wall biosynthesis [Microbacterium halimionae]NII96228.1 glycosyltransferase involved in cell wall biosynthesis [Microbacterium halimionae]
MNEIDIVFPCLNEAAALPWVLSHIPPSCRAIVVDNGSTDGSAQIAAEFGALVVSESRRGFGAAAHAGLEAATAPIVAFADADASLNPEELPTLSAIVRDGAADLVLGCRVPTQRGAWPWHARLANYELARRITRATGVRVRDLGPMRAARREDLLSLDLKDRRSGYPLEMMLKAAAARWRIVEKEVAYHPRVGRSKVTGTARGTLIAVKDMSKLLREYSA